MTGTVIHLYTRFFSEICHFANYYSLFKKGLKMPKGVNQKMLIDEGQTVQRCQHLRFRQSFSNFCPQNPLSDFSSSFLRLVAKSGFLFVSASCLF